jgi:ATPase subunit of ABC transporter with duplicated ATPase domains
MLKEVNWLVLDEPTNHLDVDAKEELKRALKDFKGSILLVSHEPEFYQRLGRRRLEHRGLDYENYIK